MKAMQSGAPMTVAGLRSLTPFTENAQKIIDDAVVEVGTERLAVAADVISQGLIYTLTDPLSVMEVQWDQESETGGAQRTMHPNARGQASLPDRRPKRVPIYLTTDYAELGIRTFKASQRIGTPLDTSLIKQKTRRVNESIEDAFINGADLQSNGYTAYGLLNAPSVNEPSNFAKSWATAATGDEILVDFMAMVLIAQSKKKYGPYTLYVGTAVDNAFNKDFKANGTLTIRQRLQQNTYGGKPLRIVVSDKMPEKRVVLVQMTSDVIEAIVGQSPVVIPWTSVDGWTLMWMVMAIIIPRIRDDYDGNSGVVIGKWA
jgi:hypothetical protein